MKLQHLFEATSSGPLQKFGVFIFTNGEDISEDALDELEIFIDQKAFYRYVATAFEDYLDMVDGRDDALDNMVGDNPELKAKLAKRKGNPIPLRERTLEQLKKHPHWSGFADVVAIADNF